MALGRETSEPQLLNDLSLVKLQESRFASHAEVVGEVRTSPDRRRPKAGSRGAPASLTSSMASRHGATSRGMTSPSTRRPSGFSFCRQRERRRANSDWERYWITELTMTVSIVATSSSSNCCGLMTEILATIGVALAQALSNRRRSVTEEKMRACCSYLTRIQRIPAAVVHDQGVGTRHVAKDIAGNSFVVHALMACTDVDRRILVPVLNPPHRRSDACEARSMAAKDGDPRLPHERGPARRPSLCHMPAPSLFAELEDTGSQCNRIVQLQLAPSSLTARFAEGIAVPMERAHCRLLLLLTAACGTDRRISALHNSVGCSGYKRTTRGHRKSVEDDVSWTSTTVPFCTAVRIVGKADSLRSFALAPAMGS